MLYLMVGAYFSGSLKSLPSLALPLMEPFETSLEVLDIFSILFFMGLCFDYYVAALKADIL
jgi:hypothetical protein